MDASALVEYLLGSARGDAVAAVIESHDVDLHCPALCDVEVVSALRALVRTRKLDLARARQAVTDHADLPLARHGHLELLGRLLELRDNFSAYDATYLALAERLDAELLTCDAAFAASIRRHAPGTPLSGA